MQICWLTTKHGSFIGKNSIRFFNEMLNEWINTVDCEVQELFFVQSDVQKFQLNSKYIRVFKQNVTTSTVLQIKCTRNVMIYCEIFARISFVKFSLSVYGQWMYLQFYVVRALFRTTCLSLVMVKVNFTI